MSATPRATLSRTDVVRIVLGWVAFFALLLVRPVLGPSAPAPVLIAALAMIVAVIVVCAFGVVVQAEALARRLGDPHGSLVLTLSIVLIEVVLISAVMLGPGSHETIARDSVMAVSMIILNLVIGIALLVGGIRRGGMAHNRTGTSMYLAMLVVLLSVALALPALIGEGGAYTLGQAVIVIVLTLGLYAFFLFRQTGAQASDFIEVGRQSEHRELSETRDAAVSVLATVRAHRTEIVTRLVVLLLTVVPIVLLSHDMASLLDDGLERINAPPALAGVLIAAVVFLPESITAVRAAHGGEVQRTINLCHGALVSTVGLTVPAVLVIGSLTGQRVLLAEAPAELLLLGVTLLLSITTFAAKRVTAIHGAAHLAVFAVYLLVLIG